MTRMLFSILLGLGLAAACSSPPGDAPPDALPDADVPDAGPRNDPFAAFAALPARCSADQWCWRAPHPAGNDYAHVYSTAHDNIWLIGQHGTVLQWNGTDWRTHTPVQQVGQSIAQYAYSISGRGPSDMWLLIGSTIQHWDGKSWTVRDSLPPTGQQSFNSIWAAPNGDVWVTMNTGSVNRSIAGGPFRRIDTGCNCYLGNLWGFASDDFWITALPGNILHFDGRTFTQRYAGGTPIGSFLGTAPDDIWVTGSDGAMVHWDGDAWKPVATTHTTGFIDGAVAFARDDVWWWAMTNSSAASAFLHWNGVEVTTHPVDTSKIGGFLYDATVIDGRWWLAGRAGALYTRPGAEPTIAPIVEPELTSLSDIWGSSADDLYFATIDSIRHWNGASTTVMPIPAVAISGVRSSGATELFAAGFELGPEQKEYIAVAWHRDGAEWQKTELDRAPVEQHRYFTRVWAMAPGEALAVGYGGLAYHYSGGAWRPIATGVTADLFGVWGPDPDHAWITGTRGTLLRWSRAEPSVATPDPTLTTALDLGAIHGAGGTTWIAAGGDAILRSTDGGWEQLATGISAGGVFAIAPDDVVISSSGSSQLARWDGTTWHREDNAAGMPTPILFKPPGGPMLAGWLSALVEHP